MRMITGAILILAGVVALCFGALRVHPGSGVNISTSAMAPACDVWVQPLGGMLCFVGGLVLLWGIVKEGFPQTKPGP